MTGVHSGQRAQLRQDFGMIMLESSSSDCLMGMSFRGKGVNPSYTRGDQKLRAKDDVVQRHDAAYLSEISRLDCAAFHMVSRVPVFS